MHFRRFITFCLTLLIGGAPLHCLAHAGHQAAHAADVVHEREHTGPVPIHEDPPPCDNESGCICKGAVVVDYVDAAPLVLQLGDFVPAWDMLVGFTLVCLEPVDWGYLDVARMPAPLSARILRAHLATYLI